MKVEEGWTSLLIPRESGPGPVPAPCQMRRSLNPGGGQHHSPYYPIEVSPVKSWLVLGLKGGPDLRGLGRDLRMQSGPLLESLSSRALL
jgi:hypothetical protein